MLHIILYKISKKIQISSALFILPRHKQKYNLEHQNITICLTGKEHSNHYYYTKHSARSPSPPRRRVQRKEAKVEEWNCVAKDDFFKADEKALAAAEKKKKEAEEEAKRIEDASNSTVSISVLRKKGNPYIKKNQTLARVSLLFSIVLLKI